MVYTNAQVSPGAVMLTSADVLGRTTVAGRVEGVPRARAFVGQVLGGGHPCADVARLLVSELVTNAVQHSESRRPGGSVGITVVGDGDGIRIEVTDQGSARSVPAVRGDILATHGRGLFLVQAMADDWGYRVSDRGTTVWCQVSG